MSQEGPINKEWLSLSWPYFPCFQKLDWTSASSDLESREGYQESSYCISLVLWHSTEVWASLIGGTKRHPFYGLPRPDLDSPVKWRVSSVEGRMA
jgi:hypothetical protein